MNMLLIVVAAALIHNVALQYCFGITPAVETTKELKTSAIVAGIALVVTTFASAVTSLLYFYVLAPFKLDMLKTFLFPLITALLTWVVSLVLRDAAKAYKAVAPHLPLVAVSSGLVGVVLTNAMDLYSAADSFFGFFAKSVFTGFGAAVGYGLVLLLVTGIRARVDGESAPKPFKGAPLLLLSLALMALAFAGFAVLPSP